MSHDIGYEKYNEVSVFHEGNTANTHITLNTHTPNKDIIIGTTERPRPRIKPVIVSIIPHIKYIEQKKFRRVKPISMALASSE